MPASTFVGGSIDIHVRFEAMGGNARRAQIFRRHEDLQRAYEHQVRTFARETRHVTSKLSRIQSEHLTRMKAIQKLEPQTFREEWPPLEERRAIAAQMQESALPLLIGAAANSHSNSTHKDKHALKRGTSKQNINSPGAPRNFKSKPGRHLNGMLGQPHWATHPTTNISSSHKLIGEVAAANDLNHHAPSRETPSGNPARAQAPVRQAQSSQPRIILSPSQQTEPAGSQAGAAAAAHLDSNSKPPAAEVVLHQPGQSPRPKPNHLREQTGVTSSPARSPRRRGRNRQGWGNHEDVLLFRVENRDGKETYTHVTRRKYPSMV